MISRRPGPAGRRERHWLAALLTCAGAAGAGAALVEEVITLASADGATQPVLISRDDAGTPALVALLFTGGGGTVGLSVGPPPRYPRPGRNFLVRERARFVDEGVATAVIDAPSDVRTMTDGYRMSARHAADVATVVAEMQRRFAGARVMLVGTSRGTVSAAHAGAAIGRGVAGVVLSSTVFASSRGGGLGLGGFDFASIGAPLLFVHHVDDACHVTPYSSAVRMSPAYPLVSVSGGKPPQSEPCEAHAPHGYFGVEAATVAAIVQWMKSGRAPERVP